MKIFKYQIGVMEKQEITLPVGAKIIRADSVEGMFFLWAIVDENEKQTQTRKIEAYKTGQSIDNVDGLTYIGYCCIFIGMELCLYIFERN